MVDPVLIMALCLDGPAIGRWWEIGTTPADVSDDDVPVPVIGMGPGRVIVTDLPANVQTVPYRCIGRHVVVELPDPRYVAWVVLYREVVADGATDTPVPHIPRLLVDDIALWCAARITQDVTLQLADKDAPADA
ncbi:MAG: hypothetical protein WC789_10610 [Lentisphaeria bacterium]